MAFDNSKAYRVTQNLKDIADPQENESDKLDEDLINACATGQLDNLKELIPQYTEKAGPLLPTPQYLLQVAAKNGQAEIVRWIFGSKLQLFEPCWHHPWEPRFPDGVIFGEIPAKWRIYEEGVVISALEGSDPLAVFKVFFDYGMEPDYNLDRAGNTTSFAIGRGTIDVVDFFLKKGAKPTGRCFPGGDTYLGTAARKQTPDMLEFLIEKGSQLEGSQALRHAVQWGRLNNAKLLLDHGVDVNEYMCHDFYAKTDDLTGTALHWAVKGSPWYVSEERDSKDEIVRFLLEHGANPEIVNAEGKTAYQIALALQEDEVIRVFKEHSIEN